jgi:hypothetical protein
MPSRPRRLRVVPALERWTCARPAFGAPGRDLPVTVPPVTAGEVH